MEDYIINIEFINNYLDNKLTSKEKESLNNRVASDNDFKKLFEEQRIFRNGLERLTLKKEIRLASNNYIKGKWLITTAISLSLIILCIAIIYFIKQPNPSPNQFITPKADSQSLEQTTPAPIDTIQSPIITTRLPIAKERANSIHQGEISAPLDSTVGNNGTEQIASFQPQYKKAINFVIDTARDTVLTGKEGTKIYIEANSFKYSNTNQKADGVINFNLEEYYQLSDMILANLSTKADTRFLETAGMIRLDAHKNNQEVKLIKPIKISFSNQTNRDFQLFKGDVNKQNINWILDSTATKPVSNFYTLGLGDVVKIGDTIRTSSDFTPDSRTQYDTIYQSIRGSNTTIRRILHRPNLEVDSLLISRFESYKKKKLIRYSYTENLTINLVTIRKPLLELDKELFKVIEGDSISRFGHIIRMPLRPNEVANEVIETLIPRENKNSLFSTLNLGWINCDRFKYLNAPKVKYKVKIKGNKGATIKMVFKKSNTLLSSSRDKDIFNFGSVPKNEPIYLILIKRSKEQYYYEKIETNTSLLNDINSNLMLLDKESFFKELQSLNALFNK